jgi:NSS family neurotransmitter:Na+ symporter
MVIPARLHPGRRRFRGRSRRHLEVPYVTAANGGGAFLLVFLLFSFTLGVAVLMGETLIGSLTRRGVVGAFGELMGRRWRWVGAMGLLCSLLIFCFYSVVGGWTLGYTGMALAGSCNRGTARH